MKLLNSRILIAVFSLWAIQSLAGGGISGGGGGGGTLGDQSDTVLGYGELGICLQEGTEPIDIICNEVKGCSRSDFEFLYACKSIAKREDFKF